MPLPDVHGKNLTFRTGGVDGCDRAEILALLEAGKIDTTPLITHRNKLEDTEETYHLFENKLDGVIKVAVFQVERGLQLMATIFFMFHTPSKDLFSLF